MHEPLPIWIFSWLLRVELDVDGNPVDGGSVDGQGNKVKHSDTVEVGLTPYQYTLSIHSINTQISNHSSQINTASRYSWYATLHYSNHNKALSALPNPTYPNRFFFFVHSGGHGSVVRRRLPAVALRLLWDHRGRIRSRARSLLHPCSSCQSECQRSLWWWFWWGWKWGWWKWKWGWCIVYTHVHCRWI